MTLIARLSHWIVLGAALLAGIAWTSAARAGFELALDSNSVRPVGDHYAINVTLNNQDDADVDIEGIIATFKSDRAGLVFLSVGPTAGGLFDAQQKFWPDSDDNAPSHGNADEPWAAWVFMDVGTFKTTGVSPAYQLEFSVAAPGEYTIDFVNTSNALRTKYSYLGSEGYALGDFTQLTPASFIVSTPEPSSCALLATAMGGMGLWRWRRRKSCPALVA